MLNKRVEPPFVPDTQTATSTENIDKMFTNEKPRETPADSLLLRKKKFDDFTYNESTSLQRDSINNAEPY